MPAHVKALDNISEFLSGLELKHDKPTNLMRVMAHRPGILRTFAPLEDAIMGPGSLHTRVKILAYLASSYVNESPTDVASYSNLAKQEGFGQEEIRAVQVEQDQEFKPVEHAAIRIARELTRTCTLEGIDQNEINLFTAEQMVELVAVIALANFNNRFHNALEISQDEDKPLAQRQSH